MEPSIDRVVTNNEASKSISVEQAEINCNNLEKKLDSQRAVFRHMVPTVFHSYLANDPDMATSQAEGDLFLRWHIKYSSLFGDYFAQLIANDEAAYKKEGRDRILAGNPTAEDCHNVKEYLENPVNVGTDKEGNIIGGLFFFDENEIEVLRAEYKLSLK